MNSYQSNMLLQQRIQNGEPPNNIRNINGDFLPDYQISQISIAENFGPFVGINMRMKNQASLRLDIKRNRQLNLSLVNNQMTDTKGYEFVLGTGYIIKDVSLVYFNPHPFDRRIVCRKENWRCTELVCPRVF